MKYVGYRTRTTTVLYGYDDIILEVVPVRLQTLHMADGRSPNSRRSQKALEALEQRLSATKSWVLELDPPPQPIPRRKRPFIVPNQVKLPPPQAEPVIVLDGFALLEACRVDDPDKALKVSSTMRHVRAPSSNGSTMTPFSVVTTDRQCSRDVASRQSFARTFPSFAS